MATSMLHELHYKIHQHATKLRTVLSLRNVNKNRKCNYATAASQTRPSVPRVSPPAAEDEEFRTYVIPGTEQNVRRVGPKRQQRQMIPPRYMKMRIDQDWTNVWPAAHTLKWSVIPFPVRQGFIKRLCENAGTGIPPGRYGNAELMKIPNFLHLTPAHVKKHCAAIKKFCTAWPEGLETDEACQRHFEVEVVTSDYSSAGPSVRDERARSVKLSFRISDLKMDHHARDKMRRLVGDRYNEQTDTVSIVTDRCPMKKQNYDYIQYLMTALYFESQKVEPWEAEKTELDNESYVWSMTQSYRAMLEFIPKLQQTSTDVEYLSALPATPSSEDITQLEPIQKYEQALADLHDNGETTENIDNYRSSVMTLLNISTNIE